MTETNSSPQAVIDAGLEAIGRHDWDEAYRILAEHARALDGRGQEALAEAAYWTGRMDESLAAMERAFRGYTAAGDMAAAARTAMRLAEDHSHQLRASVARAWLARAEALVGQGAGSAAGWLARMKGMLAFEGRGDLEEAMEWVDRAAAAAEEHGDSNLRSLALHDRGRLLVASGRVDEGIEIMEDVMAATQAGELDPMTTGKAYCNIIDMCERVADYRRAGEWDDAARRWCEDVGHLSGFPGVCRVKRAEIMRLRGSWTEAEEEARRACEELAFFLDLRGKGYEEIGTIRLQMGDVEGAEEAFKEARLLGHEPEPGLALLELYRGNSEAAQHLIERAYREHATTPLDGARLLPARAEIALAVGDLETAAASAREARAAAEAYGTEPLRAAARYIAGRVAQAEGDLDGAESALQEAFRFWHDTDMPFEAARAKLALGRVYLDRGWMDLAGLELEAAAAGFERLGASRLLDETNRLWDRVRGDRKQAPARGAWLFTDIVESTKLVRALGDEAWGAVLAWHHQMLRGKFAEHHGREIDQAGDGFFVAFTDADEAVRCAIAIQSAMARQRREQGFPARVRIGVHEGMALDETSPVGQEIHLAARVCAAAGADEILITPQVQEALRGEVALGSPRRVEARGFDEPVTVIPVVWE